MNITLDELDFIWNFNPGQPRDDHGRWTSGAFSVSKYVDKIVEKTGVFGYTAEDLKKVEPKMLRELSKENLPNLSQENLKKVQDRRRKMYATDDEFYLANQWLNSCVGSGGDVFEKAKVIGFDPRKEILLSKQIMGEEKFLGFRNQEGKFDKEFSKSSRWSDLPATYSKDKSTTLQTEITKDNILIHPSVLYSPEANSSSSIVYSNEREYILDNSAIEFKEIPRFNSSFFNDKNDARLTLILDKIQRVQKNFNPYHDKMGKFTWSPFGCYKGDMYKAVSIYGDEYKNMVKNFDTSGFTPEERQMIERYIDSPMIGNSCDKNGRYKSVDMFFDKDGNELSAEDIEKAAELYKKFNDVWDASYEERKAYEEQFNQKYTVLKGQKTPAPQLYMLKEKYLDRDDITTSVGELREKSESLIKKKYGDEYLKMNSSDLYQIINHGKVNGEYFSSLPEKDQRAFKILHSVANAKEGSYGDKFWADDNSTTFNSLRYDKDRCYLSTTYPNSNKKEIGVTLQYISTLPEKTINKYLNVYDKFNGYNRLSITLRSELDGRKLDNLITTKGVSFDKDIVLTRRISDDTVVRQEITRMGFYTQNGFTSTTAANNIAKKSPGTMVFGDNMLKIVIPAGTKVLPIEKFARESNAEQSIIRQHEVLLPTNTKYLSSSGDKTLPSISKYGDSINKWDKSLELDKIDFNNNYVIPMIAITEQYSKG